MSQKDKFDGWEVLPEEVMDALGHRLERDIKDRIKNEIDEMQIWADVALYRHANRQLLAWVQQLSKHGYIEMRHTKAGVVFKCGLIPHDYGEELSVVVPALDIAREIDDVYPSDEARYKKVRRDIAKVLREMAAIVDGYGCQPDTQSPDT